MKKILAVLFVFAICFLGCSDEEKIAPEKSSIIGAWESVIPENKNKTEFLQYRVVLVFHKNTIDTYRKESYSFYFEKLGDGKEYYFINDTVMWGYNCSLCACPLEVSYYIKKDTLVMADEKYLRIHSFKP